MTAEGGGGGGRWINRGVLFTNRKTRTLHSESVQRSRSKANTYSYSEKIILGLNFIKDPGGGGLSGKVFDS